MDVGGEMITGNLSDTGNNAHNRGSIVASKIATDAMEVSTSIQQQIKVAMPRPRARLLWRNSME